MRLTQEDLATIRLALVALHHSTYLWESESKGVSKKLKAISKVEKKLFGDKNEEGKS